MLTTFIPAVLIALSVGAYNAVVTFITWKLEAHTGLVTWKWKILVILREAFRMLTTFIPAVLIALSVGAYNAVVTFITWKLEAHTGLVTWKWKILLVLQALLDLAIFGVLGNGYNSLVGMFTYVGAMHIQYLLQKVFEWHRMYAILQEQISKLPSKEKSLQMDSSYKVLDASLHSTDEASNKQKDAEENKGVRWMKLFKRAVIAESVGLLVATALAFGFVFTWLYFISHWFFLLAFPGHVVWVHLLNIIRKEPAFPRTVQIGFWATITRIVFVFFRSYVAAVGPESLFSFLSDFTVLYADQSWMTTLYVGFYGMVLAYAIARIATTTTTFGYTGFDFKRARRNVAPQKVDVGLLSKDRGDAVKSQARRKSSE
eukprot:TRINITY_DN9281_c0_g1_i1.p1 TRINITY_DN9281_c0_g1~~TRINITY_DN9281_c0_g1_i1.p1  ORF type:complete len:372 (-),score=91.23 TRINITY_DN9281_c0_g1_i1:77-1192(-)